MSEQQPTPPFPPDVMVLAVTGLMQGMTHFHGHPYQQQLAQLYCFALRYCLLNEIEGIAASPSSVIEDVIGHLADGTPQPILDGFRTLTAAEFNEAYKAFRMQIGEEGADIEQVADALPRAFELAKTFMKPE